VLGPAFARAPVFTTRDIAAAARVSTSSAARALATLVERGSVTSVVRGVWARSTHPDFSPYAIVPFLLGASVGPDGWRDADLGYVSLLSALNLHGLIDQIPRTIQVAAGSQRPVIRSPVGVFSFHRLQYDLLTGFEPGGRLANFELATPTKALFDTLYLSTRRGLRHAHLPELDLSRRVTDSEMRRYVALIRSASLRTAVLARWKPLLRNHRQG
jgi:predicted transcriptional regulator of viral defense system